MTGKDLIKCLTVDESTGLAIDPDTEIQIYTGKEEEAYILSVYLLTGNKELAIDIGDE